jgi:hypothetical protein
MLLIELDKSIAKQVKQKCQTNYRASQGVADLVQKAEGVTGDQRAKWERL